MSHFTAAWRGGNSNPQGTASVLTEAGVIPVINHPRED